MLLVSIAKMTPGTSRSLMIVIMFGMVTLPESPPCRHHVRYMVETSPARKMPGHCRQASNVFGFSKGQETGHSVAAAGASCEEPGWTSALVWWI
jgi:hypothetical protein